jgi:hypothetical protein
MSDDKLQSRASAGGTKGAVSTVIDLRRPGDLNLVHRAIVNGWDVPEAVRNQISAQLHPAIEAAETIPQAGRRNRRLLKLSKVLTLMEASNLIAQGAPKSSFPVLRRRQAEKRRPRSHAQELPVRPRNASTCGEYSVQNTGPGNHIDDLISTSPADQVRAAGGAR